MENPCIHECPDMEHRTKHRYINPYRAALGLRSIWINPNTGSTIEMSSNINGETINYYTNPSLDEVVNNGEFTLFNYVYTSDGLFLLKHSTAKPHEAYDDWWNEVDITDERLYDERPRAIGDFPIGIGHSSLFPIEEYEKQYEYGVHLESLKPSTEYGQLDDGIFDEAKIQEINTFCKVKYAGELLYYKPPYLDNGVILYWTNGSGHFQPKNDSTCKNDLFLRTETLGPFGMYSRTIGYFPEVLFVDNFDRESKKKSVEVWYNIEYGTEGGGRGKKLSLSKKKGKGKKGKGKNKRKMKSKSKRKSNSKLKTKTKSKRKY